jgi:hypothetical protein
MNLDIGYSVALGDMCMGYSALKPPKRVSVSMGAAENLIIKQPGAAGGPWSGAETPYMIEPMDMLASRRHEAVVFAGPARTGKCLDVETLIPTPSGWSKMGDLKAGDVVFGPDGKPTAVLAAHAVCMTYRVMRSRFQTAAALLPTASICGAWSGFIGKSRNGDTRFAQPKACWQTLNTANDQMVVLGLDTECGIQNQLKHLSNHCGLIRIC